MKKVLLFLAVLSAASSSFASESQTLKTSSAVIVTTGECRNSMNGAGLDIVKLKVRQLQSWDSTTGKIRLPACQKAIQKYFESSPSTPMNTEFEVIEQIDQTGYAKGSSLAGTSCRKDQYLGYLESRCAVRPLETQNQSPEQYDRAVPADPNLCESSVICLSTTSEVSVLICRDGRAQILKLQLASHGPQLSTLNRELRVENPEQGVFYGPQFNLSIDVSSAKDGWAPSILETNLSDGQRVQGAYSCRSNHPQ